MLEIAEQATLQGRTGLRWSIYTLVCCDVWTSGWLQHPEVFIHYAVQFFLQRSEEQTEWIFLPQVLVVFVTQCIGVCVRVSATVWFWQGFFKFWSLSLDCESTSRLPCYTLIFPFLGYVMRMISHWRFPADLHCCLTMKCSPATWFALDGNCLFPCKLSNSAHHHQQLTDLLC